jgi:hypothetical protein
MNGYLLVPRSFMPNGNDLQQIKWWIAAQSGYYLTLPETTCDERVGEEDKDIAVEIIKPLDGATLTKNFEVRYTISWERPLRYVRIYLNDVVVAEESTAKKNVTQIEKIAWYAWLESWSHQVTVEVVDEEWFVNRTSHTVQVGDVDETAPILMEDKLQATSNEDGTYTIYLLFTDEGSVVKWWKISVDGQSKSFEGNLTSMVVNASWDQTIVYSVEDIHGNIAQGSTDVWYLLQ